MTTDALLFSKNYSLGEHMKIMISQPVDGMQIKVVLNLEQDFTSQDDLSFSSSSKEKFFQRREKILFSSLPGKAIARIGVKRSVKVSEKNGMFRFDEKGGFLHLSTRHHIQSVNYADKRKTLQLRGWVQLKDSLTVPVNLSFSLTNQVCARVCVCFFVCLFVLLLQK